jgi:hypothetical protein
MDMPLELDWLYEYGIKHGFADLSTGKWLKANVAFDALQQILYTNQVFRRSIASKCLKGIAIVS